MLCLNRVATAQLQPSVVACQIVCLELKKPSHFQEKAKELMF